MYHYHMVLAYLFYESYIIRHVLEEILVNGLTSMMCFSKAKSVTPFQQHQADMMSKSTSPNIEIEVRHHQANSCLPGDAQLQLLSTQTRGIKASRRKERKSSHIFVPYECDAFLHGCVSLMKQYQPP